ncbi:hypothetical protein, partial [Streptomyces werraensis]|uniref:hypothetical protein n=1 Tax=Streptomyces werraensis TaxID=68284 RepID=UPI0033B46B20
MAIFFYLSIAKARLCFKPIFNNPLFIKDHLRHTSPHDRPADYRAGRYYFDFRKSFFSAVNAVAVQNGARAAQLDCF